MSFRCTVPSWIVTFGALLIALGACGSGERPELTNNSPGGPAVPQGNVVAYRFDTDGPFGEGETSAWTQVAGSWVVAGGVAAAEFGTEVSAKGTVALATVPVGSGDGFFQVTLATSGNQAGLVFRFSNPENYWFVAAAPDFASWGLVKVIDGEREAIGNIGLAPVGNKTTVGVLLDGSEITVMLNGKTFETLTDTTHMAASSAGLFVGGNVRDSTATFDEFMSLAVNQVGDDS